MSLRKSFINKENKFDDQTMNVGLSEIGCVISILQKMEEAVVDKRSETPSEWKP